MVTPTGRPERGRAARRRGVAYERELVTWLRGHGVPGAERTATGRAQTRGDLDGLPGVHLEARNRARLDLPGWLDEATAAAGPALPVVVIRRRGCTDRGRDYAVLPLARLVELLTDPAGGGGGERPAARATPRAARAAAPPLASSLPRAAPP